MIATWVDWSSCIDFGNTVGVPESYYTPEVYTILNTMSPLIHLSMHFIVGSLTPDGTYGDAYDVSTSP